MPKGKAPVRSSLYRNVNKDTVSPSGRKLASDMRAGTPRNQKLRGKLHETVNKPNGFKEFKKFEKDTMARSQGADKAKKLDRTSKVKY